MAGVACLFGIVCIILEGILYDYDLKSASYTTRNTSSGQKYIKESIEELYNQGYENMKSMLEKYRPTVSLPLKWSEVSEKIGKNLNGENEKPKYFTYSNIWPTGVQSDLDSILNGALTFAIVDSVHDYSTGKDVENLNPRFIVAHYKVNLVGSFQVPVASLGFIDNEKFDSKGKVRACWAKNDKNKSYSCKTFSKDFKGVQPSGIDFGDDDDYPFVLNQYVVPDNAYFSNVQIREKNINVNYKIYNFPIAYKLMKYDDVVGLKAKLEENENCFYFEEDSNHFIVSGKSYAKAYRNQQKKVEDVEKYKYFYYCSKEVSSYDEVIKDEDPVCFYKYSVADLGTYVSDKRPYLNHAFAFTNVGKYPGFVISYWKSNQRDYIFSYNFGDRFVQFAFASMIIQIVGIIFVLAGCGPSF